jgi:hypothetical protein
LDFGAAVSYYLFDLADTHRVTGVVGDVYGEARLVNTKNISIK